jgi:hypothetical protein
MSTDELLSQLRSLPPIKLREVLSQIGYVPETTDVADENNGENGSKKGMTLGLLRGTFTHISDDFDAELPESFWTGEEEAS